MDKHAKRKHALLSASGSERWMNCTPSARLEEANGERTTSPFADEGTLAHEIAELYLKMDVQKHLTDDQFSDELAKLMDNKSFNEEMLVEVPKYVDYCVHQYEEAKLVTPDAIIAIEEKIDLTRYIPEGFGSNDCIILADGMMEVIDLKYGRGVAVSAVENKQLMLYGLGALLKFAFMYDIQIVKLTIHQPRIDSISSWQISYDELMNWAETELTEKAKIAFDGAGDLNSGSWCKFCSIKNRCPKLKETAMEIAKFEFAKAPLLTDAEIAEILKKAPILVEWATSVAQYAAEKAINENKKWPGFKLVVGTSRRKWLDEATAVKSIRLRFPSLEDDEIFNTSLKGITDIEKLVTKKKFAEMLSDVVIKPEGKLTLVPETDARPAAGLEQAKSDFA